MTALGWFLVIVGLVIGLLIAWPGFILTGIGGVLLLSAGDQRTRF